MTSSPYAAASEKALLDPEGFWGEAASHLLWRKPATKVLDLSVKPVPRWFRDGEINLCENALDRHVTGGRGDQTALIYDSAVTNSVKKWTYRELRDEVARVAAGLRALGVGKGDRVIIYMPMIPEAMMSMLACARIGAVHSVVFGGFAAAELAARIIDASPKVILTATGAVEAGKVVPYLPMIRSGLQLAALVSGEIRVVVVQREVAPAELSAGDLDWNTWLSTVTDTVRDTTTCVTMNAWDPSYILYTSGTTGRPKGIVRDTGGHAVALHWSMEAVYGLRAGEVFWTASDVGWVVGHSYIVYAPLLKGCTTVMFEGKPVGNPDAGVFWRVMERHAVSVFFTAPTAIRAIKRDDPHGEFARKANLPSLRAIFLAGERTDSNTLEWLEDLFHIPVVDHWWQTETGWAIVANCLGLEKFPIKHGSPTKPVPGWNVQVLDEGGHAVKPGEIGSLVVKLPMPPGSLPTLWNDETRFCSTYLEQFPGYYATADAGMIDEDGYVFVLSRTDDVINVAGHRLSTGVMEEALCGLPDVAECAVLGVKDSLKGEVPIGFLVLKKGTSATDESILRDAVMKVRNDVGPVAAFKTAYIVKRLPKTRSGKILRGTIKKMADGDEFKMPATIDDPAILDEIRVVLNAAAVAAKKG